MLLTLLEEPGRIVTREELQQKVWSGGAFGDFEHSLNIAINKIRQALGDSADKPRFVETVPRRGYRFIAPVDGGAASVVSAPAVAPPTAHIRRRLTVSAAAVFVVAVVAGVVVWMSQPAAPRLESRRLTNDALSKRGPVLSDGSRIYFRTSRAMGHAPLNMVQIPASGGAPTFLTITPPPGDGYRVLDLTPDGQDLLISLPASSFTDFELRDDVRYDDTGPLWSLRVPDGSSRRVGNIFATDARYSPDGKQIAIAAGGIRAPGSLWVASTDGSNARRLLESKDLSIVVPCWSADGRRIAFGQVDRATQRRSAWEIGVDGTGLRRFLPEFQRNHLPAAWTPDGDLLLMSEGHFWIAQSRRYFQLKQPATIQLSTGDPHFTLPIQLQGGRTFYSVGRTQLGQLERFDSRSGTWERHLGGASFDDVEYSRDAQSLVYTTYSEREMWVCRANGSGGVQLTKAPMESGGGHWSPDGRTIAFNGRSAPDQPWRIYLADAAGSNVRPACPKECRGADLTWMPDGKRIVFSPPLGIFATEPVYLRLLDLTTGEVTKFPGSEGLHSPRVSPDGSMLAALRLRDGGGMVLYRFSDPGWKEVPLPGPSDPNWPSWSRDSQSILYYDDAREEIMRVRVRDNRHEMIAPLKVGEMTGHIGYWFNVTADDEPMILRRRDVQQVYALELKR